MEEIAKQKMWDCVLNHYQNQNQNQNQNQSHVEYISDVLKKEYENIFGETESDKSLNSLQEENITMNIQKNEDKITIEIGDKRIAILPHHRMIAVFFNDRNKKNIYNGNIYSY